MKKQKNNPFELRIKSLFGICLCLLFFPLKGKAQSLNTLNANGNTHTLTYSGNYVDYLIPENLTYNMLYLKALGADGGDAVSHGANAGRGAKVEGYLLLDEYATPPGSTIRIIVGGKGTGSGDYGGGGGGTALAIKKKGASNWELLMVAGGGGGAGMRASGREGTTSTSGSNGMKTNAYSTSWHASNAGTNGNGGGAGGDAGSGGGKNSTGSSSGLGDGGGEAGYSGEEPTGGKGGTVSQNQNKDLYYAAGGWGFGAGGAGVRNTSEIHAGGGGGGYSGGGSGNTEGGGGGGGSYFNPELLDNYTITSRGTSSLSYDGQISYQFLWDEEIATTRQFKFPGDPNKCMGRSSDSTNDIELVDCTNTTGTEWVFQDKRIRLRADLNKCLAFSANANNIQIENCDYSVSQYWVYDGSTNQIRMINDPSKCLFTDDIHENTAAFYQVELTDCNATVSNQKWTVEGVPASSLTNQVGLISWNKYSDRCLSLKGNGRANGTNIQTDNCTATPTAKIWYFDGVRIRLYDDLNKCIDLVDNNTSNNTNIRLYDCKETDAQKWFFNDLTKSFHSKSDYSKCLDVASGSKSIGTNIQLVACNGTRSQLFSLKGDGIATPKASIKLALDQEKCIELKNNTVSNGSNIQIASCSESISQVWMLEDQHIKLASNSNYCMALTRHEAVNGDNLHLWDCKDLDNERWIYDEVNQFIRSQADLSKCLRTNNYNVELTTCNYGNTKFFMQWTFTGNSIPMPKGDALSIHLAKDESKCLDMEALEQRGNIRVYDCETNDSQHFLLDEVAIKSSAKPELCLATPSFNNESNVYLWPCNKTDGQQWVYDNTTGRIHSILAPNKCINFSSGLTYNGNNVNIMDCNDSDAQQFIIK